MPSSSLPTPEARRPPGAEVAAIPARAFTLVELLAAMAILSLILLVIFGISQQTSNAWKSSRAKIGSFQDARVAFDTLTSTLSQATLNTYYDYFDAQGRSPRDAGYAGPHHYGRQSDLHFVTGKALTTGQITQSIFFQTPAGYEAKPAFQDVNNLLNACGFFIMHGEDPLRPGFLEDGTVPNAPANHSRYRLMQFMQPSSDLGVYSVTGSQWFTQPLNGSSRPVQQLAENVIALVVLPRRSSEDADSAGQPLSDDYEYDSRITSGGAQQLPAENQLPPLVEVVMVSIDEPSALRLGETTLPVLDTLFRVPDELDTDLATLETALNQQRLQYRVFRTIVPLRNSKWNS